MHRVDATTLWQSHNSLGQAITSEHLAISGELAPSFEDLIEADEAEELLGPHLPPLVPSTPGTVPPWTPTVPNAVHGVLQKSRKSREQREEERERRRKEKYDRRLAKLLALLKFWTGIILLWDARIGWATVEVDTIGDDAIRLTQSMGAAAFIQMQATAVDKQSEAKKNKKEAEKKRDRVLERIRNLR